MDGEKGNGHDGQSFDVRVEKRGAGKKYPWDSETSKTRRRQTHWE